MTDPSFSADLLERLRDEIERSAPAMVRDEVLHTTLELHPA